MSRFGENGGKETTPTYYVLPGKPLHLGGARGQKVENENPQGGKYLVHFAKPHVEYNSSILPANILVSESSVLKLLCTRHPSAADDLERGGQEIKRRWWGQAGAAAPASTAVEIKAAWPKEMRSA